MNISKLMIFLVGTLILLQSVGVVGASHSFLECEDFEGLKLENCEEIMDSDLSDDEKEVVLQLLEEDSADDYEEEWSIIVEYQGEGYSGTINEIETERLILAWKIFLFGAFNYFVFSVLTKSSFASRWRNVAYST